MVFCCCCCCYSICRWLNRLVSHPNDYFFIKIPFKFIPVENFIRNCIVMFQWQTHSFSLLLSVLEVDASNNRCKRREKNNGRSIFSLSCFILYERCISLSPVYNWTYFEIFTLVGSKESEENEAKLGFHWNITEFYIINNWVAVHSMQPPEHLHSVDVFLNSINLLKKLATMPVLSATKTRPLFRLRQAYPFGQCVRYKSTDGFFSAQIQLPNRDIFHNILIWHWEPVFRGALANGIGPLWPWAGACKCDRKKGKLPFDKRCHQEFLFYHNQNVRARDDPFFWDLIQRFAVGWDLNFQLNIYFSCNSLSNNCVVSMCQCRRHCPQLVS